MSFQTGDVVRLKSGGPNMTVREQYPSGSVFTNWFHDGELKSGSFFETSLEYVPGFKALTPPDSIFDPEPTKKPVAEPEYVRTVRDGIVSYSKRRSPFYSTYKWNDTLGRVDFYDDARGPYVVIEGVDGYGGWMAAGPGDKAPNQIGFRHVTIAPSAF